VQELGSDKQRGEGRVAVVTDRGERCQLERGGALKVLSDEN
jgi:hypothetical protein